MRTRRTPASWDSVCDYLTARPETVQTPPDHYHAPAIRVRGKTVAYLSTTPRGRPEHVAADDEILVVRIAPDERVALIQQDPLTYFVTPHYESYPGVLIRLATVDPGQLRELLDEAWHLVAPKRLARAWDAEHGQDQAAQGAQPRRST